MKRTYSTFTPILCSALTLFFAACDDDDGTSIDPETGNPQLVVSTSSLMIGEDDTDDTSFTVRLTEAPGALLEVAVVSGDEGAAVITPAALGFTDRNFDLTQVVTVNPVADADAADESLEIILSHTRVDTATIALSVTDDDIPNIEADPAALVVDEAATATGNIRLSRQPGADVIVTIASSDTDAATVSPTSLTFTPEDFAQNQIITVTGVEDADVADETVTLDFTAADLPGVDVTVTVLDDDS